MHWFIATSIKNKITSLVIKCKYNIQCRPYLLRSNDIMSFSVVFGDLVYETTQIKFFVLVLIIQSKTDRDLIFF